MGNYPQNGGMPMIDCRGFGGGLYSPPFQAQAVINECYGEQLDISRIYAEWEKESQQILEFRCPKW